MPKQKNAASKVSSKSKMAGKAGKKTAAASKGIKKGDGEKRKMRFLDIRMLINGLTRRVGVCMIF